jgi:hypothetical protein
LTDHSERFLFIFEEDLGVKREDFHVCSAPSTVGKPGLAANAVQKPLSIPSLIGSHLRKEESAASASNDLQAIATDENVLETLHLPEGRKDGNGNAQAGKLVGSNGLETVVFGGGGSNATGHGLV